MAEKALARITRDKRTGNVTVYWQDGTVRLYESEATLRERLQETEIAELLVLSKFFAGKPQFADAHDEKTESVSDIKATVDFTKADEAVTIEAATVKAEAEVIPK